MNKRIALIFGSTGLVGNLLLAELIRSEIYSGIKIFVRQKSDISDPKVDEIIIDFSNLDSFSEQIKGDDLFICIGTTIKKAGSVANMEKIDRDLPVRLATIAQYNGVRKVAVVSSIGANSQSGNYYLRIKGEMEEGIIKLGFKQTTIGRPSMLLGDRNETRTGEIVGKAVMRILKPLLIGKLRKYRAINGRDVARALISVLQTDSAITILESDELQSIAENNKNNR
jgi:uncharacterized protein YbjT (DUF2867 family)